MDQLARGLLFCALAIGTIGSSAARAADGMLPDPILQTLARRFSNGEIKSFGIESENGVSFYLVHLTNVGARIGVEIAPDGNLGEIEAVVELETLPTEHQALIRAAVGRGEIRRIERHERIGLASAATFAPVPRPAAFYEVRFREHGRNRSVRLPVEPGQAWVLDRETDGEEEADDDER